MPTGVKQINTVRNIGWGYNEEDLQAQLDGFSGSKIIVPINSFGGSVFEGMAMYNILKGRREVVNTKILGIALSMGTILSASANDGYAEMPENGYYMVHNPSGGRWGDAKLMESYADLLRTITNDLANIYIKRITAAGKTITLEEVLDMMERETWMSATKAFELGLVDKLTEGVRLEANANLDYIKEAFDHAPANLFSKNYFMDFTDIKNKIDNLAGDVSKLINSTSGDNTTGGEDQTPGADGKGGETPGADTTGGDTPGADTTGGDTQAPGADTDGGSDTSGLTAEAEQAIEALVNMNEQFLGALTAATERLNKLEAENQGLKGLVNKLKSGDSKDSKRVAAAATELMDKVRKELKVSNETEF
jgi:ATP-dependent Clp endopeptidase proteolytic subunit ClpP